MSSRQSAAIARWVSILAHPFVMVTLLVTVSAMGRPHGAIQSAVIVVIALVAPVAVLMARQVRRGRWSNIDASNRSERPILFAVAIAAVLGTLVWLWFNDPHSYLVRGMLVMMAFLSLAAVMTRWVKLSLHVACAALTATALSLVGSWAGYALIPVVPALFWSRLLLARHQVHELVTGLALGIVTGIVLVRI